jgi:hypothetical protein
MKSGEFKEAEARGRLPPHNSLKLCKNEKSILVMNLFGFVFKKMVE